MGLFDWLGRRPAAPEAPPAPPPSPPAPPAPKRKDFRFLVLMEKIGFTEIIEQGTPFAADHAQTLAEALGALSRHDYDGVLALSPPDECGSAARVFAAFRERKPKGLCVYHGWDYRIEVSMVPALRCGADFLLVGGVLEDELLAFFNAMVERHRQGLVPPPSWEWYAQQLIEAFPRSPCWAFAEAFRRRGTPPNECE